MRIMKTLMSGVVALGLMITAAPPKQAEAGVFKKALTVGAGYLAYRAVKKSWDAHHPSQAQTTGDVTQVPNQFNSGGAVTVGQDNTASNRYGAQAPTNGDTYAPGSTLTAAGIAAAKKAQTEYATEYALTGYNTKTHVPDVSNEETLTAREVVAQSQEKMSKGQVYANRDAALATVTDVRQTCTNPTYIYSDTDKKCEKGPDSYGDENDPTPHRPR